MYMELLSKVSPEFPIEYYHTDTSFKPHFQFPAQWHPDVEMLHIIDGVFHVKLNSKGYTLRKGDVLFINPETVHSGTPENCIYQCVVFSPSLLLSDSLGCRYFFENLINREYTVNEFFPAGSDIAFCAEEIFTSIVNKAPGYKFKVIGSLYKFFGEIVNCHFYSDSHGIESDSNNLNIQKLKKVISFIQTNYSSPLSLEQLADATEMSVKYFCSFFKKMTGKTPFTYLIEYRIAQAVQKLTSTELSVTEVAYSCGFNDLSYFIKMFRLQKGISPGQFRKISEKT